MVTHYRILDCTRFIENMVGSFVFFAINNLLCITKSPVFTGFFRPLDIIPTPLLKSYPYCIQQLCIIFILYAVSILRFIFVVKWYKRRFSIASKERR